MAIQTINNGETGLEVRGKLNENFTELYAATSTQSTISGLISGGQVVWETGYQFRISAAEYAINGVLYTSIEQTVTLTAADGSNARIDVIYLDNAGLAGKITGTAAALPTEPDVEAGTQLKLTFVLVAAASSAPSTVSNTSVYLENTEWTSSTSGSGFNANSTNNPYAGTKCIEGTTVANGAYVSLQAGAPITLDSAKVLAIFIRSKAAWTSGRVLRAQWYSAGVAKGVPVTIASGYWGFDSSITSGYQQVAIPIPQFVVPAGTSVNQLRITDSGGSIGFYIDNIILQAQGTDLAQSGETYITQAQGDARYSPLGAVTASGHTQATNKLLGRGTAATGAIEEITLGAGLAFSGTTLNVTAGGSASGTSNPVAPASGDRFYRTDLKLEIEYDGTRWMTTQLLSMDFANDLGRTTTGTYVRLPHPGGSGAYNIYITDVLFSYYLSTTGNWTIALTSNDGSGGNVDISTSVVSTSGSFVSVLNTVGAVVTSAVDSLALYGTENSGSASLSLTGRMEYRRIVV